MLGKLLAAAAYFLPSIGTYLTTLGYVKAGGIVGTVGVIVAHGSNKPAFLEKAGVNK